MINIFGNMPGIVAVTTGKHKGTSKEEHVSGVFAGTADDWLFCGNKEITVIYKTR